MVFRYLIKCGTCTTSHTLRISVGHNNFQDHSVQCVKCGEEMHVRLELDFKKVSAELKCIENCDFSTQEGTVVNLHPELPVPSDQLHKDGVFPWLSFVRDHFEMDDKHPENIPEGTTIFRDVHSSLGGQTGTAEAWSNLKKGWSLHLRGKHELSEEFLSKYKYEGYDDKPILQNILYHFSFLLLIPNKLHLVKEAVEFVGEIKKKHPLEYQNFLNYFKSDLQLDHSHRYFEIYSEYFNDFSEYNQVLLYSKQCKELNSNFTVSSINFKKTKMFYGNAFEILTSNFVVLACLNNIAMGREYDQFEQMTLSKYITINKANKANPFNNTSCFTSFSSCIDSKIRNASHHKTMKIDKHGIVLYRSPGSSTWNKISYPQYLFMCNEIILSLSALHMLELILNF